MKQSALNHISTRLSQRHKTALKRNALKNSTAAFISLLLMALPALSHSAPAGWYIFQSKSTGEKSCLQNAPGHSWKMVSGPYRDAGCRVARKRQARKNRS
ncbi:MAG: hypothetical protein OIF57_11025 [Marinobacterium sp.]|nr:hypothetical protein [Marinobacterium sp.]